MVSKTPKNKQKIEMKITKERKNIQMKKTKGRQKIEIKRIEKEDDRFITFSKRRSGIYKKASEIVTLTGTQVTFLVFSPSGKPYSFSHPSIDSVTSRFMGEEEPPQYATDILMQANKLMELNNLNKNHNELLSQLKEKKEKGEQLEQKMQGKDISGWWSIPVRELTQEEIFYNETWCKSLLKEIFNTIIRKTNGASTSSSNPSHVDQLSTLLASINIDEDELPSIPPPPGYDE